jgi:signal transduction histidine kinase/ligand-binding sensor domain-containing protein/DNA-binding response OmpR family regulator
MNTCLKASSFFFLILTLLLPVLSYSQEYRYRTYDVERGLSNNKVNCIYKDSKGFLWVGTSSGLNRFDGYSFKTYFNSKADTNSLYSSHIESIQEDSHGNLLIGCGGSYSIYHRLADKFSRDINSFLKPYGANVWPSAMFIAADKSVWMYDSYNGSYCLPNNASNAVKIVDTKHLLSKNPISQIVQIDKYICFISKLGEIIAVDAKTRTVKWCDNTINRNNPNLGYQNYSCFIDHQNRMWIYSVDGVWVYNFTSHRWNDKLAETLKSLKIVKAITEDDKGNIWIGQDQCGLAIISSQTNCLKPLKTTERLSNKTIESLYSDSDGNVWIGTYKTGLYQYNESMFKFNLYEFPDVNCIADGVNNYVWIGTDAGTLIHWNRNTLESVTYDLNYPLVSLCSVADGSLWIGTYRGGLKRFKDGNITNYGISNGLASNNVWSIISDNKNGLWLGTLGGGLQYFNTVTQHFDTYNTSNSALNNDYINSLCLSHNGSLYIGTTQGVMILNPASRLIRPIKSLALAGVSQLYEDTRGFLWIATFDGLFVYNPQTDTVQPVDLSSTFISPYVLGLAEDKQGDIWASIGSNVIKIHINDAHQVGNFDFVVHAYTQSDGLQPSDFNQRSLCRLADGEILVGGLYGVNSFIPHLINYDHRTPNVMFVDMRLFGQPVKVGEKYGGFVALSSPIEQSSQIDLGFSQNEFTIYFSTDNYVAPEKTVYYYRLQGFNSDWIQCPPNMHQVTYTNLTPGTYRLEVKAVSDDGVESRDVASLTIVIHPPFWLSPWAKFLYLILALLAIFFVLRYIKRRERKKYIEQKKTEASKQQEELAQMKFQFFTNISHELRTPLTLILSPLEALIGEVKDAKQLSRLKIMHNNATRLLYLVNQLLDFRKSEQVGLKFLPSEGDVVAFTRNICDNFSSYSENKNVQLTFFSSHQKLNMLFDGDKYSKIILNLLSNAFKFTPDGGRVDVAITTEANNLIIKVADTGIGIADNEKQHVFEGFYQTDTSKSSGSGIGLALVKEYVKLHDGTVEVVDNIGSGSVFIVSIPIRQITVESIPVAIDYNQKVNDSKLPIALIVDDNADLLAFLSSELSRSYNVLTAVNGLNALEIIEKTVPDIIISDIMMPEMDGIELCRRLKSDSKFASVPIIILSAKHDEQAKVEGLTIGADDYVTKPFNCDLLKLRMKKLLQLSNKGVKRSLIEPEPTHIQVTSLDEKLIESAVKYVEKNMARADLSVEELSRQLGMSRVHLYKRMRQITGKTPIEFIRVLRLKRAAQLLRESQLNVSEIAYQVGFNNPKYFANYFKQEFGVLPSVYQTQQSK